MQYSEIISELKAIGDPRAVRGWEKLAVSDKKYLGVNLTKLMVEKIDSEKAHSWMAPLVPAGKSLSLHVNLIRFGRKVCKAIKPQCSGCFLSKECLYSSQ